MIRDDGSHVKLKQIHFARGSKSIFNHLDLNIARGQITVIMGPSGTGKTTLLRLIGGQLQPQRGQVWVDDLDLAQLSQTQLYGLRRRMGYLFQHGALFTDMSVYDNIAFPYRANTDLDETIIRDLVYLKLEAVGLRGVRHHRPNQLSGGMARRVALARAIALDPELMMYDEPFTGQDPIAKGVLKKLIQSLNQVLGMTSVVVSHDVPESLEIADVVCLLSEGRVVASGTPEALRDSSDPYVRQFLDGRPDGVLPFHHQAPSIQEDFELPMMTAS